MEGDGTPAGGGSCDQDAHGGISGDADHPERACLGALDMGGGAVDYRGAAKSSCGRLLEYYDVDGCNV